MTFLHKVVFPEAEPPPTPTIILFIEAYSIFYRDYYFMLNKFLKKIIFDIIFEFFIL